MPFLVCLQECRACFVQLRLIPVRLQREMILFSYHVHQQLLEDVVTTGHFSFAGAIAGAAIMRLLTSLMVSAGVSSYMTSVFQGLILIVTVIVNSLGDIMREKKKMEVSPK